MPSSASSSSRSEAIDWDAALPVTWGLAAALVLAQLATAVFEWHRGYEDLLPALFLGRSMRFRVDVGGQLRPLVADGEVWRLWTSALLHGDGLHLLVNTLAIGTLGRMLEPWIGGLRLLSWFAAGAVAGAALSHQVGVLESDGASGGAFALLGAIVVVAWKRRATLDADDRRLLGPVLWGFLGLNLVLSFVLPFINAAGHVGGLLAGMALGALWNRPRPAGTAAHALWLAACAAILGWGIFVVIQR